VPNIKNALELTKMTKAGKNATYILIIRSLHLVGGALRILKSSIDS
jgi:hypothetical protein